MALRDNPAFPTASVFTDPGLTAHQLAVVIFVALAPVPTDAKSKDEALRKIVNQAIEKANKTFDVLEAG